jgi:hypothetical protein
VCVCARVRNDVIIKHQFTGCPNSLNLSDFLNSMCRYINFTVLETINFHLRITIFSLEFTWYYFYCLIMITETNIYILQSVSLQILSIITRNVVVDHKFITTDGGHAACVRWNWIILTISCSSMFITTKHKFGIKNKLKFLDIQNGEQGGDYSFNIFHLLSVKSSLRAKKLMACSKIEVTFSPIWMAWTEKLHKQVNYNDMSRKSKLLRANNATASLNQQAYSKGKKYAHYKEPLLVIYLTD